MENELNDKSNFLENIEDLHRLHLVTKNFKHGIELQPDSWKMFEPSKFVYSYFAFNSFYNYDWQKSCEVNTLFSLDIIDEEIKYIPEEKKMKTMIDFIFNHIVEEDKNEFIRFIKKPVKEENPIPIEKLIESIDGITPDNRISESERLEFKKNFNQMISENKLQIGKLKNMARFVYLVRNNIFHGTKDTINMMDKNQRNRLEIYSNILIGLNELLFKSIERKSNIKFEKKYNFKFNDRN
jgi:hypothetical protein